MALRPALCYAVQLPARLPCPQEEEVEKSCESCGGSNLPHNLRHTIRRLPRVLVLHMKRFKVRREGQWPHEMDSTVEHY
jgi:ubiquitin C-terminal hydrolase